MILPTNFTDQKIDSSQNVNRKYIATKNNDDTYSFTDVTIYENEGSAFSADNMNSTNTQINTNTNKIGNATLKTVAQSLTSGINEICDNIDEVNDSIDEINNNLTTNVTEIESGISFIKSGNVCIVSISKNFTLTQQGSYTNVYTLPKKAVSSNVKSFGMLWNQTDRLPAPAKVNENGEISIYTQDTGTKAIRGSITFICQ